MEALSCKRPEMRVYERELLPIRQVCFIQNVFVYSIKMMKYNIDFWNAVCICLLSIVR